MKLTYDHKVDALYIELTDHLPIITKRVNDSFMLHLDESDQVAGIEILNARKFGIDPLTLITQYYTPDMESERPDPEAVQARRAEIVAARKRKRQQEETP